jgi:hypothetical protein
MTRDEGIRQIDTAEWLKDEYNTLHLKVEDQHGRPITAWLTLRPYYCDRGHIQLLIDGPLGLDAADSFPRYFFSFAEADMHTRTFLRWRMWKERLHSLEALSRAFSEKRAS